MSAISDLRDAVTKVTEVSTNGFATIQSAMEELATDLQNIPLSTDIEAETTKLSNVAEAIGTQASGFAQAIRDAVPTPTSE